MIEGNLIDRFLHLEHPWRCILLHRHDRCFNWRAFVLHAGYFLDDDRDLFREVEVLPHPVANLFERIGRDFDVAPRRVSSGRRVALSGCIEAALEAFGDLVSIERAADEDQPVDPLLAGAPGAAGPSFEIPMHPLQEKLVVVALKIKDPLHPQHPVAEFANQRTEPDAHLKAVELARLLDADSIDILKMVVVMMSVMRVTMVAVWTLKATLELNGEVDVADVEDSCEVHL